MLRTEQFWSPTFTYTFTLRYLYIKHIFDVAMVYAGFYAYSSLTCEQNENSDSVF